MPTHDHREISNIVPHLELQCQRSFCSDLGLAVIPLPFRLLDRLIARNADRSTHLIASVVLMLARFNGSTFARSLTNVHSVYKCALNLVRTVRLLVSLVLFFDCSITGSHERSLACLPVTIRKAVAAVLLRRSNGPPPLPDVPSPTGSDEVV